MSIASEITVLAKNKAAIKAAIEAKNPIIAPTNALAQWPTSIASIPDKDEWQPPSDWPNIAELLNNDTENYINKIYILWDARKCATLPNIMNICLGADKVITSDGSTYTSQSSHIWSSNSTFVWTAHYSNSSFTYIDYGSSYQYTAKVALWLVANTEFSSSRSSAWSGAYAYDICAIDIPVVRIRTIGQNYSANRLFFSNQSLRRLPKVLDLSHIGDTASGQTSVNGLFSGCINLRSIDISLDFSSATNTSSVFQGCYALQSVPEILDISMSQNISYMFFSCYSLYKVPNILNTSNVTNAAATFGDCRSLISVPSTLNLSNATNVSGMFSGCNILTSVPSILDISNATNAADMFRNCYRLIAVPDILNLSSITSAANQNNMFTGCYSLQKLPTHVISNWSINFSACGNIRDKDSIATFIDNTITGGFIGNINECPNSSQTITLNSTIKNLFTTNEQSIIQTTLNDKNWTLSW